MKSGQAPRTVPQNPAMQRLEGSASKAAVKIMADKRSILFTLGTRPEAIKLMPVIRAFQAEAAFKTHLCVTGQHRELLDPFLGSFDLRPDFALDVMSPGQSLAALSAKIINACEGVFERLRPGLIFVQGDTTSAFAAATTASQCRIPVAHVEAGLRSHRKFSPFPEEFNRVMIAQMAELHFAPSEGAAENLRREGVTKGVHVVGNTIVDALQLALRATALNQRILPAENVGTPSQSKKSLLVTLHRRESFGYPLESICAAICRIAGVYPEIEIICPVHPNPGVQQVIYKTLAEIRNIHLLAPLSYVEFIRVLSRASLVISDSGGVLEEAITFGLPVLVAREVTERKEAFSKGNAILVGYDAERIFAEARTLLDASPKLSRPSQPLSRTFGDGHAATRILRITRNHILNGMDSPLFDPVPLPTAA